MDSAQLLEIEAKLADVEKILAEAMLDKNAECKDISMALARKYLISIRKDVLDHASEDLLKGLDV